MSLETNTQDFKMVFINHKIIQTMKLQVLHDSFGNNAGVYLSPQEWTLIKRNYPDIEEITEELPDWQKQVLTSRLEAIAENPERIKPIKGLIDALNKKVK
jgi:hypothetical protein